MRLAACYNYLSKKKKKKEPIISKKQNPKFEVLTWWKEHYNLFPELSLMAQDLISTGKKMHLNQVLAQEKKILTPYRSCLLPENVEAMLCTKSLLHGFEGILIY